MHRNNVIYYVYNFLYKYCILYLNLKYKIHILVSYIAIPRSRCCLAILFKTEIIREDQKELMKYLVLYHFIYSTIKQLSKRDTQVLFLNENNVALMFAYTSVLLLYIYIIILFNYINYLKIRIYL